jgi:hypothetical protein
MIKKFNQFIKESVDKYENSAIGVGEMNDLVEERSVTITENEMKEIEDYLNEYSQDIEITTSTQMITKRKVTYLNVVIVNHFQPLCHLPSRSFMSIAKLTDDWFILSFTNSSLIKRIGTERYKCDELKGLLIKIEELIKTHIST